jgi:hypothetical protein
MRVAADEDSCFNKFGNCFMNPIRQLAVPPHPTSLLPFASLREGDGTKRTNFPQLHPQVPIGIKFPSKPPTIIKNTHEPQ